MLHKRLPTNHQAAPRKRLRGLRGYFRGVFKAAASFHLDVSDDAWYDYWHYHPDREGYGNLNRRMRAQHIEALSLLFGRFTRQLCQYSRPYQLWIYLDVHDAALDAVYVHSPNPNEDDFPLVADCVEWGLVDVSAYFERLLPEYRIRAGWWGNSGLYVYSPDIGVSLEEAKPSDMGRP